MLTNQIPASPQAAAIGRMARGVEVPDQAAPNLRVVDTLWSMLSDTAKAGRFVHRHVASGQRLIHGGRAFESLYFVHAGFFRTVAIDDAANAVVLGFPMRGDLIGTDGIGRETHCNEVVALSSADVISIPFLHLAELARVQPGLDEVLFCEVSRQLVRDQLALAALTVASAESRLAGFLLRFGARLKVLGFSDKAFNLPMSRADIGSYLGIKIETASRGFTALAARGLIEVNQRSVTIVDADGLTALHHDGRSRRHAEEAVAAGRRMHLEEGSALVDAAD